MEELKCNCCNKIATELFECTKCNNDFCEGCQAEYNQFTQIDYDCCTDCATSIRSEY